MKTKIVLNEKFSNSMPDGLKDYLSKPDYASKQVKKRLVQDYELDKCTFITRNVPYSSRDPFWTSDEAKKAFYLMEDARGNLIVASPLFPHDGHHEIYVEYFKSVYFSSLSRKFIIEHTQQMCYIQDEIGNETKHQHGSIYRSLPKNYIRYPNRSVVVDASGYVVDNDKYTVPLMRLKINSIDALDTEFENRINSVKYKLKIISTLPFKVTKNRDSEDIGQFCVNTFGKITKIIDEYESKRTGLDSYISSLNSMPDDSYSLSYAKQIKSTLKDLKGYIARVKDIEVKLSERLDIDLLDNDEFYLENTEENKPMDISEIGEE